MQYKTHHIFCLFLAFIFLNCNQVAESDSSVETPTQIEETSNDDSSDVGVRSNDELAFGSQITPLSIEGSSATIDFEGLADDDEVIFVVYAYNENETAKTFTINYNQTNSDVVSAAQAYQSADADQDTDLHFSIAEDDEDITSLFHQQLRKEEEKFERDDVYTAPQNRHAFAVQANIVGNEEEFYILDSLTNTNSYVSLTAELRVQTPHYNFYVDVRDENALTDEELQELSDDFEDRVVMQKELLGEESDVNEDGRFDVLFTREVNDLPGSSGGIVTGFFFARDLFDLDNSNRREIFYVHVPDPSGQHGSSISKSFFMSNLGPSVLMHEYQHMISYNQHVFINGGSSEQSWLNEGMSHLQEDLASINEDGFMESIGIENPSRVDGFLQSISTVCFSCGSSLDERGGSYLFLRYLYEQAEKGYFDNVEDGADLLAKLINTSATGIDNIVTAIYGDNATTEDFKELIGLFGLALYLSDTGLTTEEQLELTGVNLRGGQNDNRGTVLNGPTVRETDRIPYTSSVTGSTVSYVKIPGEVINQSGSLTIEFTSGADFGAYVIVQ